MVRINLEKIVKTALLVFTATSINGCKLIKERTKPFTIYNPTVTSHWQKDFSDPEVGYFEEMHFVKFDNYDGCLKDKSMKLRKDDELIYAEVSKRIIPGGCPQIIDYVLKTQTP